MLYVPGWPQTQYITEEDLKLTFLPLSTVTDMCHHAWFYVVLRIEPRAVRMLGKHYTKLYS